MPNDRKLDAVPDVEPVLEMAPGNNLSIWDQVDYTPPSFTKDSDYGRNYTSIDPQFQTLMATKMFGPCGMGWGLRNCTLSFEDFPVIRKGQVVSESKTAILQCEFWYKMNGELHTMEVMVDMVAKAGDDTLKKLQTMARSKALSWLGFSSDVYLGLFDDDAYVRDAKTRQRAQADSEGFLQTTTDIINDAKTLADLDGLAKRAEQMAANKIVSEEQAKVLLAEIESAKEKMSE